MNETSKDSLPWKHAYLWVDKWKKNRRQWVSPSMERISLVRRTGKSWKEKKKNLQHNPPRKGWSAKREIRFRTHVNSTYLYLRVRLRELLRSTHQLASKRCGLRTKWETSSLVGITTIILAFTRIRFSYRVPQLPVQTAVRQNEYWKSSHCEQNNSCINFFLFFLLSSCLRKTVIHKSQESLKVI